MHPDEVGHRADELRRQIHRLEENLATLRDELARCDLRETETATTAVSDRSARTSPATTEAGVAQPTMALPRQDYARYGRQMIVPNVGLEGKNMASSDRS